MSILSLSSFAASFTLRGTFASIVDRFRSRCNAPEISAWTSQVSTIADKHNKSAQLKAGGVELCRAKLKNEKSRKIKGHKVIKSQMWWRQAPMDSMLNMIKLCPNSWYLEDLLLTLETRHFIRRCLQCQQMPDCYPSAWKQVHSSHRHRPYNLSDSQWMLCIVRSISSNMSYRVIPSYLDCLQLLRELHFLCSCSLQSLI